MSITTSLHYPANTTGRVIKRARPRYFIDRKKKFFITKRAVDLILSLLCLLLVLSWLIPILALLIKLDSRGPVFFVQRRVGRGGRSFRCYKFRTMVVNKEADSQHALENDARITKVGRFLRLTNMDEFPQFFNVLLGQMSVVGPRPHMHADCSRFAAVIPRYKFRNLVKPGITGLAQVKGYHGHADSYESIFRRYQWDVYYIRNAGWKIDLAILFTTVFRLAQGLRQTASANLQGGPLPAEEPVEIFLTKKEVTG